MEECVLGVDVQLLVQDLTDVQMRHVTGIEKIRTLLKHTYRNELLAYLRPHESYLQQIMRIASHFHVFRIERPIGVPSKQQVCDMMLEKLYVKM